MAESKRRQDLAEKGARFEKETGKSRFSPALTTRLTQIRMWVDQGESLDRIRSKLPGVNTEELQNFLAANGLVIKVIKSRRNGLGS